MTKPNLSALMAAIDQADGKLAHASAERRSRDEQLQAAITQEAILAAEVSGLRRALLLLEGAKEQKAEPAKRKARKPRSLPPTATHAEVVAADRIAAGNDPFPIIQRAK